jgi:multidrug efflux pump subunit AcrA (membrane-fusion protein)
MMNPLKSGRARAVVIAGAALAAIGATGLVFANSSSAAESRWVTATAATGDVTQTFTATGSVTRKNTEAAAFAVDGTVNDIKVTVGDEVDVGQVLATVGTRALKLALLQAETTVAQAELNLYNAQHPSSSSSAKKVASSNSSSSSSSSSKKPTTPGLTTVTINLTTLNEAVSGVNLAVVNEAKECDAIMAWVNEELTGSTSTPAPTSSSSEGSSGDSTSTPSAEASASESASPSASVTPSAEETTAEASPSASATQYAATSDPTEDELKACATARAELNTANTTLQTVMAAVNAAANPTGGGSSSGSTSAPSGSSGSSSSSSSSSVSKSQVASAKATLLQANQKLQAAEDNLAEAELLAPISGVVGTITLTEGGDAGSGTITIVGSGDAVVSIEVPLKTRGSLAIGQAVQVTPAGSTKALDGKVTNISLVETSGTAGSSPTYTTTVSVPDADQLLASGSKAAVTVPVKAVTGVVTVPASAVTPTGTGTATVQVLASGAETPTTTTVKTGAVGGGRVEITEGLTAGQVVVLADRTADLPSNTTNRRTTSTTNSRSSSSSSSSATAAATTAPSSQPTK